jgi:hypothetical protein
MPVGPPNKEIEEFIRKSKEAIVQKTKKYWNQRKEKPLPVILIS